MKFKLNNSLVKINLVVVVIFSISNLMSGQIDDVFLDNYELAKLEPVSLGITELYLTKEGVIINKGRNGRMGILTPDNTISAIAYFSYIGLDLVYQNETAIFPESATTRVYSIQDSITKILVTKERDEISTYLPLNPYEPWIEEISFENGIGSTKAILTEIDSLCIGPLDILCDTLGGYYVYGYPYISRTDLFAGNYLSEYDPSYLEISLTCFLLLSLRFTSLKKTLVILW